MYTANVWLPSAPKYVIHVSQYVIHVSRIYMLQLGASCDIAVNPSHSESKLLQKFLVGVLSSEWQNFQKYLAFYLPLIHVNFICQKLDDDKFLKILVCKTGNPGFMLVKQFWWFHVILN